MWALYFGDVAFAVRGLVGARGVGDFMKFARKKTAAIAAIGIVDSSRPVRRR
jgi:hypothetical protein